MIEVEGLTKYYGEHAAIRDLSFSIRRGEVIGFLGLNGAGKSTTLKVLGCVLLPTSGRVTIDGFDVTRDPHEIRKRIGFLPDSPPLYNEMTVGAYLEFVARLRGVAAAEARTRVAESEEKTNLREAHDQVIGDLSHGFRQRVGLAQALVHRPALLILDEPTSGLDPVQIVEMRGLIRNLRGEHTILLSSHILPEIHQTCDRVLVIHDGAIIADGTEEEMSARMGGGRAVEIEIRDDPGGQRSGAPSRAKAALEAVPGVTAVDFTLNERGGVELRVDTSEDVRPALVRALVAAGVEVLRVDQGQGQLESIFLRLTHAPGSPASRKEAVA